MLISNAFLDRIKGIPNDSFLYFEELRLVAALKGNESFAVCPTATAEHLGGATAKTELISPSRHYFAAISCFRYTRDYHRKKLLIVILVRTFGLLALSGLEMRLLPALDACRALQHFLGGREARPTKPSVHKDC